MCINLNEEIRVCRIGIERWHIFLIWIVINEVEEVEMVCSWGCASKQKCSRQPARKGRWTGRCLLTCDGVCEVIEGLRYRSRKERGWCCLREKLFVWWKVVEAGSNLFSSWEKMLEALLAPFGAFFQPSRLFSIHFHRFPPNTRLPNNSCWQQLQIPRLFTFLHWTQSRLEKRDSYT